MRAQLLHLSGPLRGRTVTYPERVVRVGSDERSEARMLHDRLEPAHATIEFVPSECQFHLRRADGQVFVNGTEIEEVVLEDGDQIEFGKGGPMARFRIYVPTGAVCKPVRRMLADAADVAKYSGGATATQMLTKDLLTQATPTLKVGFPILVVAAAFLVGWLGGWLGSRPTPEEQQRTADMVTHAEVEQQRAQDLAELERTRAELEQLKQANERQRQIVRQVQTVWPRGVCLIHGIYRVQLANGSLRTDRFGAVDETEYTGSGFLVSAEGHIVTNRHVALPWLEEPGMQAMIDAGAKPEFTHLTATFPGKQPIVIDPSTTVRREDDLDVAVFRLDKGAIEGIPVLPLSKREQTVSSRAIVIGYPTGLKALLARADSATLDELRKNAATMSDAITQLAAAGKISPVITQGIVSNVEPHLVAYDASTTHGGSGGPVFGDAGEVIAVNFAIQRSFGGNNLGVPIRFARELLPE